MGVNSRGSKVGRVGSVRFLNAVPLTRGLEQEVIFDTPSALAGMLERNDLDRYRALVADLGLRR